MIITSTKKIKKQILQELREISQGDRDVHSVLARLEVRISELSAGHDYSPEHRELLVERKRISSKVSARLMSESL